MQLLAELRELALYSLVERLTAPTGEACEVCTNNPDPLMNERLTMLLLLLPPSAWTTLPNVEVGLLIAFVRLLSHILSYYVSENSRLTLDHLAQCRGGISATLVHQPSIFLHVLCQTIQTQPGPPCPMRRCVNL